MKKDKLILLLILFLSTNILAQTETKKLTPNLFFDFWIGNWDLKWENNDGSIGTGENHIFKILDSKVIQENFKVTNDPNMQAFTGKSWSVYNSNNDSWYQTWVDNQGAYLDFVGEFKDTQRIFKREITKADGSKVLQRMIFYNIKEDSFTWDWENSTDNGKSWNLLWRIEYKRKV